MNKIPVLHYMYMAGFVNDDGKWDSRPISQQEDNFKTFAELIVQECIGIVEDAVLHREPASTYVGKIREHFGFEE